MIANPWFFCRDHAKGRYTASMRRILVSLGSALFAISVPAGISAQLTPANESKVAAIATDVLRQTGVPSASVGIVTGGKIVYTRAFGMARIEPALPATADMAYPIGSISKQFTATAVLLLQQQGKLSIDDTVAKYFPDLTRAKDVTLRNLLTMTSGYEDFAPEDYSIPAWYKPTDPATTVKEWAGKPLDFEPGTKWQYSNTNFVLLGLIVEKVTGGTLRQIFTRACTRCSASARRVQPIHRAGEAADHGLHLVCIAAAPGASAGGDGMVFRSSRTGYAGADSA
jgi:CubicO group peptidase (beta-lactamase class C family)